MRWRTIGLLLGLCLLVCVPALATDNIYLVGAPSGGDDTSTLQDALTWGVSHPGCTVQLDAGTYLTSQLFAKDFHGTFKGRGMDVTLIQALPDLEVSQDQPVWINPPTADNKYPMLILFFGGDITVSDMTIRVLELNPLTGWYSGEGGTTESTTYMWALLEFMGQSEEMNVVVTRVALKGAYGEGQPSADHYNATGLSLDPYPPFVIPSTEYLTGTFRVSACRFDTFIEGIWATIFHEAQIAIGGSPSEANTIQNCDMGAVFADLDSSVLDFSYNDVSVVGPGAWAGLVVGQRWAGPIETPSSILARRNRFRATGSYEDGIWLFDYGPPFGEGKSGDFIISDNAIMIESSESGPALAGIQTDFTEGMLISNNRFVGSGLFGIVLEGDAQAMVKANNVEKMTADVAPIGLMTNLWFAPDLVLPTTDSTVLGFGKKANVYDEGENNTLVGVNNMHGNPPGPTIRDAMKRKMEMIKSMRKP